MANAGFEEIMSKTDFNSASLALISSGEIIDNNLYIIFFNSKSYFDNKLSFLQTGKYDNENDNSNVIYTELNGYKFMFMGDASKLKEEDIIKKYKLTKIDFLKVGHHGSKTSSSKEFINKIKKTPSG